MVAPSVARSLKPNLRTPMLRSKTCLIFLNARLLQDRGSSGNNSASRRFQSPYMFRLAALGADQFWSADRRPRVAEWYRRLSARPAFQTAVSWPDESGGGYEIGRAHV